MTSPLVAIRSRERLRLLGGEAREGSDPPVVDGRSDADVVEDMARALRSGRSIEQAIRDAAGRGGVGLAGVLGSVATAVESGRPTSRALREAAAAADTSTARVLRLMLVGVRTGGRLADVLDEVAVGLRRRDRARADASTHAAQARASAAVLAALPIGFVALSVLVAPAIPGVLFLSPIGWVCLGAGLGLDIVGWWWMRHLIGGVGR